MHVGRELRLYVRKPRLDDRLRLPVTGRRQNVHIQIAVRTDGEVQDPLPVRRNLRWTTHRPFKHEAFGASTSDILFEHAIVGSIDDLASVWKPHRRGLSSWPTGETRRRLSRQVEQPDVSSVDIGVGQPLTVR